MGTLELLGALCFMALCIYLRFIYNGYLLKKPFDQCSRGEKRVRLVGASVCAVAMVVLIAAFLFRR